MNLRELCQELVLIDGRISERETELIKQAVAEDHLIDSEELQFMIDLRRRAQSVHPAFDEFLFCVLKKKVLRDGVIDDQEARWLQSMIFQDRQASPAEIAFLKSLNREARSTGKEFQRLLKQCTSLDKTDFYG